MTLSRRKLLVIWLGILTGTAVAVVSIRLAAPGAPASPAKSFSPRTFRDAMRDLYPDGPAQNRLTAAQTRLAEGLRAALAGKMDEAVGLLRSVCQTDVPGDIRRPAGDLLGELLVGQEKWADFLREAAHFSRALDDDLVLARAFQSLPPPCSHFPSEPVELAASFSPLGTPMVEVEVNGLRKWFWLDTGAGLTVLTEPVARAAGVPFLGADTTTADTATRHKIRVRPAMVAELRIGTVRFDNLPAIVVGARDLELRGIDRLPPVKIEGIVGWKVIRRMVLALDYRSKRVRIARPERREHPGRNLFWLGYPIVRLFSQTGAPVHFGLDTGARNSSLAPNIIQKLGLRNVTPSTVTVFSAGGRQRMASARVRELDLVSGPCLIEFREVSAHPVKQLALGELDGILGSDIARDGTIAIDWENGWFELTPAGP